MMVAAPEKGARGRQEMVWPRDLGAEGLIVIHLIIVIIIKVATLGAVVTRHLW